MGYLDGFGVTISKWLGPRTDSGRRVTLQYPEQTRPKPERFHGRHVLNRYEDGMEKCIGCELCAGVCPARCIYVRGADNDPDDPTSPGERYGYVYEINYLRCIHCDLCVEACPTEAITETKLFEFAFSSRADAIYTKAELVVGDDGAPQQLPWENWDGGFDPAADTSGWMRATAPGGDEDFVGIVAWAGELGYGVRAPEGGGAVAPETVADLDVDAPVEPEGATAHDEPVAMAAGTDVAPALVDPIGTAEDGPAPLLVDVDPGPSEPESSSGTEASAAAGVGAADAPGRSADDADDADVTPPGEAASAGLLEADQTRPGAGLFDAPDADEAPAFERPSSRRSRRRNRTGRPSSRGAAAAGDTPARDTAAEDAAVVAGLDAALPDLAPEPEPAPADSSASEGSATDGSGSAGPAQEAPSGTPPVDPGDTDGTDDGDGSADGGEAGDEPGDVAPPAPTAGFFDAVEDDEPEPKGRRGRRRRGGR